MSCHDPSRHPAAADAARLSGRLVDRLAPVERCLLWALRRRVADAGRLSALLVHGFRLASGLALLEPALAAFGRLCGTIEAEGLRDLGLLPLPCPCVSADAQRPLALVLAPRPAIAEALARLVVPPAAIDRLVVEARASAALLDRSKLVESGGPGTLRRATVTPPGDRSHLRLAEILDADLLDRLELGPVPVLVMLLVLQDLAQEVTGHLVLGLLADLDRLGTVGDPLELAPEVAVDHLLRALANGELAQMPQVPKMATSSPSNARFGAAGTAGPPFEASVDPILPPSCGRFLWRPAAARPRPRHRVLSLASIGRTRGCRIEPTIERLRPLPSYGPGVRSSGGRTDRWSFDSRSSASATRSARPSSGRSGALPLQQRTRAEPVAPRLGLAWNADRPPPAGQPAGFADPSTAAEAGSTRWPSTVPWASTRTMTSTPVMAKPGGGSGRRAKAISRSSMSRTKPVRSS